MGGKLNWDRCTRQKRACRNGSNFAFAELPAVGSIADRVRHVPWDTVPTVRDRARTAPFVEPVPGSAVPVFTRLQLLTGLATSAKRSSRSPQAEASIHRHLAAAVREAQGLHLATLKPSRQRALARAIEVLDRIGHL